jgi:hypothetical protein
MKNKNFDCVKMMRDIRDKVTEELKPFSSKELVDHLNKKFPEFNRKITAVK